jgi:hypothetical protein
METVDDAASTAVRDLPQQSPLSQSVADPAGRSATPVKQMNPARPSDEWVHGEADVAAATVPSGTPQAGAGIAAQVNGEKSKAPAKLPVATTLPNIGDWSQPAVKASAKEIGDTAGTKKPDLGSTTEPGKSKAAEAGSAVNDGPSHSAQNSGQPTQHSQTDPCQGAAVAPKAMDSGMAQAQAVVIHTVSHEAAPALHTAGGVEDASHQSLQRGDRAANEPDSGDAAVTSGINTAKLIQTLSETEMRVGMRSSEFGNISIRTSVSQQQMQAQISLDHNDLSQALSSHVSSVQTKLENEYGLHASIEVNQQGALSSGDSGNTSQREQREFVRSGPTGSAAAVAEPEIGLNPGAMASANNGYRLDIRA